MAEPLNATFFAFKKRENGGVLLGASIAFVIALVLLLVAFGAAVWFALGGSDFLHWYSQVLGQAGKGAAPDAPPNLAGIFWVFPIEFAFLFFYFILIAAYESACLRWMIRGERSGALQLCFGADMWRVYGTYWVWLLFFVLSGILFWIVMLVVGIAAGSAGDGKNAMMPGLAVMAACIVWVLAWITVAVRLAPAAATSVGIGEFAPLKAWSVSGGRFWALFGSFLLATLLYIIVGIVLGVVFFGAFYGAVFGQIDWSQATSDPVAFNRSYEQAMMQALHNQFSNPVAIATYFGGQVVMWALAIVFYLLLFGINARAVQAALEEGKVEKAAPAS